MKKILVVGVILLFLGSSIPAIAQPKEHTRPLSHTLYVGGTGPGNYSTIQAAINDAKDGDTIFVFHNSSPYSGAEIFRSVKLIGEDKETTKVGNLISEKENIIITGLTIEHISVNYSNTVIRDNIITGSRFGITAYGCHNLVIMNNTLSDQEMGIQMYSSDGIISGNTIIGTDGSSLGITIGSNCIVENNTFIFHGNYSSYPGLSVVYTNNTIRNNSFINTGLQLEIYTPEDVVQNTISGNSVNGKPLVFLKGKSNEIVDDAGQVYLIHCRQIQIRNLTIEDVPVAITLYDSYECNISNNSISRCAYGISLGKSSKNMITKNRVFNCSSSGIIAGYAFAFAFSGVQNRICQNLIKNCNDGITIWDFNGPDSIQQNIVKSNYRGVRVVSDSNNISMNNITGNSIGLSIAGDHNIIHENNIIKNSKEAIFTYRIHNIWQKNYWNQSRTLPYIIIGYVLTFPLSRIIPFMISLWLPWINIDWHPARQPYAIAYDYQRGKNS